MQTRQRPSRQVQAPERTLNATQNARERAKRIFAALRAAGTRIVGHRRNDRGRGRRRRCCSSAAATATRSRPGSRTPASSCPATSSSCAARRSDPSRRSGSPTTAQAEVTLEIEEDHAPLPEGTRAEIQQLSQSGIANRFVELTLPQAQNRKLPDGATIPADQTRTNVELDQVFNTLDPKTRRALQGFFKGQARQFRDAGDEAREGFTYLNPSLSSTSRLFQELTRDTPALERFLVDSSRLVTTLAERRTELAALVGNANRTTRALGNQKEALAESIGLLPPFMRRANTTFVNLRAALDDLDPLVEASAPGRAPARPVPRVGADVRGGRRARRCATSRGRSRAAAARTTRSS